jgi:hypothetical protein
VTAPHALSDGGLVGQLHTSSVRCGPPAVTPGTARKLPTDATWAVMDGRPARPVSAPWIRHRHTRNEDLWGGQPYAPVSQLPFPSDLRQAGSRSTRAALSAADGNRSGVRTVGFAGPADDDNGGFVGVDQLDRECVKRGQCWLPGGGASGA